MFTRVGTNLTVSTVTDEQMRKVKVMKKIDVYGKQIKNL